MLANSVSSSLSAPLYGRLAWVSVTSLIGHGGFSTEMDKTSESNEIGELGALVCRHSNLIVIHTSFTQSTPVNLSEYSIVG